MSWSVSFKINREDGIHEMSESNTRTPEHEEQYVAALEAAVCVFRSGAVGSYDKTYRVALSGHGNKDHEPDPAWANDFVSINIYQEK